MMVSAAFTYWCDLGKFAVFLAAAAFVVDCALDWFLRWYYAPTVGARVISELDAGPDEDPVPGKPVSTRYQRKLAYEFKGQFGEMRYNKANRIIATEWCLRTMTENDVRAVDRVRLLPMAVELCLLPTVHSVEAATLARTHEVRQRRSLVEAVR